eukprot:GHVU01223678.1.p1 GENE.GHVU01223678.1~~GHVU01223678.1.p1  ORF type:complete len:107 (+),score=5.31 GHVU01223678.1:48-323(+)
MKAPTETPQRPPQIHTHTRMHAQRKTEAPVTVSLPGRIASPTLPHPHPCSMNCPPEKRSKNDSMAACLRAGPKGGTVRPWLQRYSDARAGW